MHSFEDIRRTIDRGLREELPETTSDVVKAMRYATLGSAKRLRPSLLMAVAKSYGVDEQVSLKPALSLEMVHIYSLIHDDLPCMDNDDFRRGKPTVHKAFSEHVAVLAGDALLNKAFQTLASSPFVNPSTKIELIEELAKASGDEGMIRGQELDLSAENKKITLEELYELHKKKTGELFKAAATMGGILGNAPQKELEELKDFGLGLGFFYQILDDIVDVTKSFEKHGKHTSTDEESNKCTFVTLLGLSRAKEEAARSFENLKHHFISQKELPKLFLKELEELFT